MGGGCFDSGFVVVVFVLCVRLVDFCLVFVWFGLLLFGELFCFLFVLGCFIFVRRCSTSSTFRFLEIFTSQHPMAHLQFELSASCPVSLRSVTVD